MTSGSIAEQALRLVVLLPILLLAVSVKEAGHAVASAYFGDDTATRKGRATLWPASHFDPLGGLLLPALLILSPLAYAYGYGRPVPVDPSKLRRPKLQFSLVALAGPLANALMAVALAVVAAVFFLGLRVQDPEAGLVLGTAILVNALLACLNLLPLPGFAGLKALYALLPDEWCWRLQNADRYYLFAVVAAASFRTLDLAVIPGLWLGRGLCHWAGLALPVL